MKYYHKSGKKQARKLIIVVGPTASGKSALAIAFARKYNGEVISADSRQVYKGLEIGSGAVSKKEARNIPHHLIGIINPKRTFTVSEYKRLARNKMEAIWKKGKLPILVGGTGLYIRAAVDGLVIPDVKPNPKLRRKLEKKSVSELSLILKKKDVRRWREIDQKNPRRLVRAIEIAMALGKVPAIKINPLAAEVLFLGIRKEGKMLESAVRKRVAKMVREGLVAETKKLAKAGVPERKIREFGFEYSNILAFIGGEIASKPELIDKIAKSTRDYAKRQMTWFRKDNRIIWIRNRQEAIIKINKFLIL
ncbi:MAG: tRNA (adenosine(37)-N6)-dimethylallyltransferase MiaA [Patescibacteria group bacterium]